MCYSAQVKQAYQEYVRMFGAEIDIREFVKLYASREIGAKVKTAKSMDDAFLRGGTPETREIAGLIASCASFRSRKSISTSGSPPANTTSPRGVRFSMIAGGHTTPTNWQRND